MSDSSKYSGKSKYSNNSPHKENEDPAHRSHADGEDYARQNKNDEQNNTAKRNYSPQQDDFASRQRPSDDWQHSDQSSSEQVSRRERSEERKHPADRYSDDKKHSDGKKRPSYEKRSDSEKNFERKDRRDQRDSQGKRNFQGRRDEKRSDDQRKDHRRDSRDHHSSRNKGFGDNDSSENRFRDKKSYDKKPHDRNFRDKKDFSRPFLEDRPIITEETAGDNLLNPSPKMRGAIDALIELDQDIMKLLVRRAKLVSRIRQGKKHPATPIAIQAEKTVRKAWEKNAPFFSRDTKFSRQLFSLLQELAILQKDEAPKDSFKLYPPQLPVSGAIPGHLSTLESQIWVALSSLLGHPVTLKDVPMNLELGDTVKTFSQLGLNIMWEPAGPSHGSVTSTPSGPITLTNKAIYVGDSLFTLYLIAFIAAGTTGICRLTGGSNLKSADLSPLRQTLPFLGTRLAHVIPHSSGLPINLECSGNLPSGVTLPENLPLEGVCALMVAPLVWNIPLSISLEKLPAHIATTALALVSPLYAQLQADVETYGPKFRITPKEYSLPPSPEVCLDPSVAACMLAIPAFVGGNIALGGTWPAHMPEARMAEELLRWAGLKLSIGDNLVQAHKAEKPSESPLPSMALSANLAPLYFALAALDVAKQQQHKKPELLFFEEDHAESIGEEMLERVGVVTDGEKLTAMPPESVAQEQPSPWACPDAHWGIAYALCSFLRPGLQLANPTEVSLSVPMFWPLFNSLPNLQAEGVFYTNQEEKNDPEPTTRTRRRIITD